MADRRVELREDMTAAHDELLKMLDSLDTDGWKQSTYEGWDRKDTFAHLASIQARQRARIQSALEGTPWNAEDVNTYNARKVDERKSWTADQVRDEYEREQSATLALLEKMNDEDLQRTYQHEVRGAMTVESVFVQVATHTRNHANDIMAAKQGATPSA